MRWVITKDVINADDEKGRHWVGFGSSKPNNEARRHQPLSHINSFLDKVLNKVEGLAAFPFEFRLLDDDGEVYYEGRCGDLDQADESAAFAPLDWARNNDGCTTLEYRRVGESGWEVL